MKCRLPGLLLSIDSSKAQEASQFGEFDSLERFRKHIGDIVVSVNVQHLNFARLYSLAEEVILYVDMFDALMERWVFR